MTRYFCYFCSKEITNLVGCSIDSLAVHHINGNHEDDRPANRVNAHFNCHNHYHTKKQWNDPILRTHVLNGNKRMWTNPLTRVPLLVRLKQRWNDLNYRQVMQHTSINHNRLQICKLCGFDLHDDMTHKLSYDQWLQHHSSLRKHLRTYHETEVDWKHFKLSDYFISRPEAERIELVLIKTPNTFTSKMPR